MSTPAGSAGPTAPTRARYWVVVFAVTLAIIQYIDRVCISQAAPSVSADLGLEKWQMGWVFSAFTLAYALFEIPTGYWGDRRGPRRVLLRVVLWWSIFTAATGLVRSFTSLLTVRFLFGAGEAGCFPNLTKAFSRWLPVAERPTVQSVMWMSARWGGAVTPLLVIFVLQYVDWRLAFMVFGLLGLVWASAFARWFRDDPRTHPAVNEAEAASMPPADAVGAAHFSAPWRKLLRSRSVWLLCGQYFACSYGWYFFVTWFPTYLLEVQKFDLSRSGVPAGLPLFLGGCGMLLVALSGSAIRRWLGDAGLARRLMGVVGFGGAGACLLLATHLREPRLAVAAIAFASFWNDLTIPGAWAACMDVGGPCVGTLSGMMNMVGNVGGFLSPIVLGYILQRTGDWNLNFYVTAGVYAFGALCWWLLDPVTPLEQQVRE
jgi:sugar phosphate permease